MSRILCFAVALTLAANSASADPYWIAYEGNDFPENVGWDRHWGVHVPPGDPNSTPDRSIEDGVFVLDTTSDIWLYDYYEIDRAIDPELGETFVAEWRVAVDELLVYWDTTLVIARDDPPGDVTLRFGVDSVLVYTEDIEFQIGAGYHDFRFESQDMREFDLFLDGSHLHHGLFESESLLQSFVAFGNGAAGASALSRWDHVRFGVIPEPKAWAVAVLSAALFVIHGRCARGRLPQKGVRQCQFNALQQSAFFSVSRPPRMRN